MNVWEEIRAKLDIVDVIGDYIPVQASGQNFRALSPFKKEKTPSLMISPAKQIWHDFSTGRGGDIFKFVCEIEGIAKGEALKKLARKAGVELKKFEKKSSDPIKEEAKQNKLEEGYQKLEWTAELYHQLLLKILQNRQHPVTQYCLKRKLSSEIIKQFKIGYAPKDNWLLSFIKSKSLQTDIFLEIGVLKFGSYNNLKDKFSDRLIIPIVDSEFRTVGFTARVLPYDKSDRPKYLNSSQSAWFDKSKLWFGLDKARKNIILHRQVILVEGNMDVIAAFTHKLPIAIASQGTSFTENQLKILKRVTQNIILAFDNDEAGKIAGDRLFVAAQNIGFNTQKLLIPSEFKDIDEWLNSTNQAISIEQLSTQNYLEWWLSDNIDSLQSHDTVIQKQSIQKFFSLINQADAITREQFLHKLSHITDISFTVLKQSMKPIAPSKNLQKVSTEDPYNHPSIKNEDTLLITTWQRVLAISISSFSGKKLNNLTLEQIFLLVNSLYNLEVSSLQEYILKNKEIVVLIWEDEIEDKTAEYYSLLIKTLSQKLDQYVHKFMLNPAHRDIYLELKQVLIKFF